MIGSMSDHHDDVQHAIQHILKLRQQERSVDETLRNELASVREFLQGIVGPTVSRTTAARLLGITRPALERWVKKGAVSSVLTPKGRREIPLTHLIDLLEEVDRARAKGAGRPLSAVMREREKRSTETVDLERLLPRARPRTHRTPELHGLAYHRLIAERLNDPIVEDAKRRLRRWRESGRIHPHWAEEWERILNMPVPRIAKAISADTRRARELRQTSPFAGLLTEQERRRLARGVEERALG